MKWPWVSRKKLKKAQYNLDIVTEAYDSIKESLDEECQKCITRDKSIKFLKQQVSELKGNLDIVSDSRDENIASLDKEVNKRVSYERQIKELKEQLKKIEAHYNPDDQKPLLVITNKSTEGSKGKICYRMKVKLGHEKDLILLSPVNAPDTEEELEQQIAVLLGTRSRVTIIREN